MKGIPLSLQTTNTIVGRGASKDIDILIEPSNLIKSFEILKKLNFKIPVKNIPYTKKSILGEYSRFIHNELQLYKDTKIGRINIDLH